MSTKRIEKPLKVQLPLGAMLFVSKIIENDFYTSMYHGIEATENTIAEVKRIRPELKYFINIGKNGALKEV